MPSYNQSRRQFKTIMGLKTMLTSPDLVRYDIRDDDIYKKKCILSVFYGDTMSIMWYVLLLPFCTRFIDHTKLTTKKGSSKYTGFKS